ncbi:hypothetical protein CERZMDRAFT_91544 [Cercospora zeae-maydis SCOH1-5]|uniref:Uncharacterized protein n=1 Tax=Cercospora zeae-maydis SCOH1-5 TaxID=717836 RepID=A0A6A6F6A6_9PEZI|nr:hypothetical protein CERZMDRAFT_91544 [Cercospora zeae-maydis SCOH1-5]
MVRVSEHLRQACHRVKSWSDVRLRLSDATLSGATRMMGIEAELMRKQHEVFGGFENAVSLKGRFLSGKLAIGEAGFRRAKTMLKLLDSQPLHCGQSDEMLAANIKRIRRIINSTRQTDENSALLNGTEGQAVEWERAREETPNGLLQ